MLANGDTIESLLRAYQHIERADINACLEYAAALAEEQVTPIEKVASGMRDVVQSSWRETY